MPPRFQRRESIGSRIFVGYGVIMALAMGFMVVVVSLLIEANTRHVRAIERQQRLETTALQLKLAMNEESDGVRGFLLQGEEAFLEPYREAMLRHQQALDELRLLASSPAETATLADVLGKYDQFLSNAEREIGYRRQGWIEASINHWQNEGRQSKEDLQKAIDRLVEVHQAGINASVTQAAERQLQVTLLMMLLMIIAGVSVILSGRRITRSITGPVGHLVEVATAFSQGALDRRATVQTRDELDTLARVMNEMAANLAVSRAAAETGLRQTEQRNRQLATLNGLAVTLSQSLHLPYILERALEHVLSLAALERGWVWLLNDETFADEPIVTHQVDPAELASHNQPSRRAHLLEVARQSRVVVDEWSLPVALGVTTRLASGASLLVPLVGRDGPLGLMALTGAEPRRFDVTELDLLQAIGRQIGVGIENARLVAAEQRLTREALGLAATARDISGTRDLGTILSIIASDTVDLLNVDRCLIVLPRDTTREHAMVHHFGWQEEMVRRLEENTDHFHEVIVSHLDTTSCLVVPDVVRDSRANLRDLLTRHGAVSVLSIGLRARGRTLGLLCADTVTRARDFTTHDQRVAVALADQASVGIESALLYAGLEERASQLAGLYEISKVISATREEDALCQVVYRETSRLMQADAFFVARCDPLDDMVRYIYLIDAGQKYPEVTAPAASGLSGHVIRTRRPLMLDVEEAEAMGISVSHFGDPGQRVRSLICVPLIREGRVLGLMSTQSYRGGAYTSQHLELFMSIANQAAIALENADLRRRERELAVVEERGHWARELHDSATQLLFSITMTLQAGRVLLRRNPAQAEQQIERAQQTAQEALAEMRALIHQLRPAPMSERGLVATLSAYLNTFGPRSGLQVDFQHACPAQLSDAQEEALFRIAQEALHNVQKHAAARTVTLRLVSMDQAVTLEVQDDGQGMPLVATSDRPSWGLTNMRERAEMLGGNLEIESAPGAGTRVRVRLPLTPRGLTATNGRKEPTSWSP